MSEMDVSRVDPEEVVVDFQTVEDGDVSAEIDDAALAEYGKEDKVLVSIRCVASVSSLILCQTFTTGRWSAFGGQTSVPTIQCYLRPDGLSAVPKGGGTCPKHTERCAPLYTIQGSKRQATFGRNVLLVPHCSHSVRSMAEIK